MPVDVGLPFGCGGGKTGQRGQLHAEAPRVRELRHEADFGERGRPAEQEGPGPSPTSASQAAR